MKKVIVVGNSKDLLLHKNGAEIDAFERIVRINSFSTEGFTEFVGSRIDIASVSLFPDTVNNALIHSKSLIRQAKEVWSPSWKGKFQRSEIDNFLSSLDIPESRLHYADDFNCVNQLKELFSEVNERSNKRLMALGHKSQTYYPTTGLLTLFMTESVFSNSLLYLTGFGQDAVNKETEERFDTSGALMWNGHDIPTERVILKEKVKSGKWILL